MTPTTSAELSPLHDFVVIKPNDGLEEDADGHKKTAAGIYVPDTAVDDVKSQRGTVRAVGPGRYENGILVPMTVKVGDPIIYRKWSNKYIPVDNGDIMVHEVDILAVEKPS